MWVLSMTHSVILTEQTGFDVTNDYGEDIFHSSQHHRKKKILQLDQDYMLTSPQLATEYPTFISTIPN